MPLDRSLAMNRIAEALEQPQTTSGALHLRIQGETTLSGSIKVRSSKNAAVALLCASLLNRGRTVLRGIAQIEEVNRILEVLASIGVRTRWLPDSNDLEIIPPPQLDLAAMDEEAARRTRTIIMFFGPLLQVIRYADFAGAIAEANNTQYGLAAAVWTADISKAHLTAKALRAGSVWVNQYDGGDMTAPFGGYKQSGNGRDKSLHAFDKYTEIKATWIKL